MPTFRADNHLDIRRKIHPAVWALGFVSLFMDISSEIIHCLLPVFLVIVIGASVQTVGLIEGVAEATAMVTRVFSGSLSDWLGKRKTLAMAGYSLGALSKPLFALASSSCMIFSARFIDRVGKGIRGAPRDAVSAHQIAAIFQHPGGVSHTEKP